MSGLRVECHSFCMFKNHGNNCKWDLWVICLKSNFSPDSAYTFQSQFLHHNSHFVECTVLIYCLNLYITLRIQYLQFCVYLGLFISFYILIVVNGRRTRPWSRNNKRFLWTKYFTVGSQSSHWKWHEVSFNATFFSWLFKRYESQFWVLKLSDIMILC